MKDETNNEKAPLTYPLGDKLKLVVPVETSAPKRKRNPRSGVDFPDLNTPLSRDEISEVRNTFQQKLEDMRDKNNEANTASQNLQNNKETHMTIQAITNTNTTNATNAPENDFDRRALIAAESAVRSLEKVAYEGITIKQPSFERRSALGSTILGGVIGGAIGGAAAATAMALLPSQRSNEDIINAGGCGFSAGMLVGAGIGFLVGSREPTSEKK
jgi:hypothetical protein